MKFFKDWEFNHKNFLFPRNFFCWTIKGFKTNVSIKCFKQWQMSSEIPSAIKKLFFSFLRTNELSKPNLSCVRESVFLTRNCFYCPIWIIHCIALDTLFFCCPKNWNRAKFSAWSFSFKYFACVRKLKQQVKKQEKKVNQKT